MSWITYNISFTIYSFNLFSSTDQDGTFYGIASLNKYLLDV